MMKAWRAALAVAVIFLTTFSARAELRPSDGATLAAALRAAKAGDWAGAETAAARADPVARDVVRWLRLSAGIGGWSDYSAFLQSHPDWPQLDQIRAHAERAMPARLGEDEVRAFFAARAPRTGTGALRLARVLEAAGERTRAADTIIAIWSQAGLTPAEFTEIRARHPQVVAKWSATRLDHLIWRGDFGAAERVMPLAGPEIAALARARLALRRDAKGVDSLIAAVSPALLDDAGLAFDRFQWRIRRDRWEEAEALLLSQSSSAIKLGRPDAWAPRRLAIAHRAMRRGDYRAAYRIAAEHYLTGGENLQELEWFAGWLALRKLRDPRLAQVHFERFRSLVDTPISLGRAGYWLGRTYEALGNEAKAAEAYRFGARYQTSFYGQLAAEQAGLPADDGLGRAAALPDWRRAAFMARTAGRAALLLHYAGEPGRVWQFLTHLARQESRAAEIAAMAGLALELGRPHIAVRVAKIAAGKGMILMEPYYPVTELARIKSGVPAELALAIARQESELNPEAISPAGARGLMQLMPATAQKVAHSLGLDYSRDRLTTDWQYNAQLGQTYLAGLIDAYGCYPLAAAGYNAGPHRVNTWLAEFGDPRSGAIDMVDWIETIPFAETRNYVMRVMEGLHVYRSRLAGGAVPIQLSADLGRRV
ncbi:MAG TPA: lytic transglycosylase domain-containing protein [Paracoccaceae bacterium]|nr:lytic transglycosylase domain-containing protein [Paracoccaceae bacterium]